MNSCDIRFYARDDEHEDGPQLAVQLKCTATDLGTSGELPDDWRFVLKRGNYVHLASTPTHPPRVLVVVKCPQDPDDWVSVSPTELLLTAEAWWVSLQGQPAMPAEQDSITVSLPQAQRFDAAALLANMRSCP